MYYIFKKSSKGIDAETRKTIINRRLFPLTIASIVIAIFLVILVDFKFLTQKGKDTTD
jgi:hypothetical protein